jgi:hypothetical protein
MIAMNRRSFLSAFAVLPFAAAASLEAVANPINPSRDEIADPVLALAARLRVAEAEHERAEAVLLDAYEQFVAVHGWSAAPSSAWWLAWERACWSEAKSEDAADAAAAQVRHAIQNTEATTSAGIAVKLEIARQALDRRDTDEARDLIQSALEDLQAIKVRA